MAAPVMRPMRVPDPPPMPPPPPPPVVHKPMQEVSQQSSSSKYASQRRFASVGTRYSFVPTTGTSSSLYPYGGQQQRQPAASANRAVMGMPPAAPEDTFRWEGRGGGGGGQPVAQPLVRRPDSKST